MKYKQLTAADRGAIEILLQEDFTPSSIAKKLGRHKSTIIREIHNRGTPNGYFADIAQIDYETKQKRSTRNAIKIKHSRTRDYIISRLSIGWSPEEISGRMRRNGRADRICHETIYRFIYSDPYFVKNKMYQYLRRAKKKRTKWRGRRSQRGKIPNTTSIEERPRIVDERKEYGHWEADSVIYPNKKAINTMNELVSGWVEFTKLDRKTARETARAMIKVLRRHRGKTVTVDNGIEFTNHEKIARETGSNVYFCHPYSSWERGANENANMLLRGYLPKRCNIDKLTQSELDDIAWELNNRPRKRLDYATPAEVRKQILNSIVAVRSRM